MLHHLTILSVLSYFTNADTSFNTVEQPDIDYQSFNDQLTILGNFDSISFYNYEGQSNTSSSSQKNLYLLNGESEFKSLYPYNGSISHFEKLSHDSVLITGDFQIDNYTSPVIYNITRNGFVEINGWHDHVDGDIMTIFYDKDDDLIYFGGDLSYDDEIYGLVIYHLSKREIVDSPFRGFNEDSTISSILKIVDSNNNNNGNNDAGSIIFGGHFDSLGDKNLLTHKYTNHTIIHHNKTLNGSNITISVDPENLVSLKHAVISSVNTDKSVSDDDNLIICPDNDASWLLNENSVGSWTASLPFDVNPTKLRLYNSLKDNSGIEYFRIITSPTNGIMNLSYIDPLTKSISYCDAWCPLSNITFLEDIVDELHSSFYSINSTLTTGTIGFGPKYQEFEFVNGVNVGSLTVQVLSSYGDRAGLSGLQLYQSGILTYANDTLNEPNCDIESSSSSSSEATLIGSAHWDTFKDQDGSHLMTKVSASQLSSKNKFGITFYPNVTYSGNYSILFFTPGCKYDNTCSSRGIVNVTLINGDGDYLTSELLYQNNEEEKYDTIYTGHLDVDDAVPYIDMVLDSAIGNSDEIVLVADRVQLNLLSVDQIYYHNDTNTTTSKNSSLELSIPLNGVFEYSLKNFSKFDSSVNNVSTNGSTNVYVGNSTINLIGSQLLSKDAVINGMVKINETLYIAGDFESPFGSNFIGVSLNGFNKSSNSLDVSNEKVISGGVNGIVTDVFTYDNTSLILVGDFNKTVNSTHVNDLNSTVSKSSISNIAMYDGAWLSFENGTTSIINTFTNLTFNGVEYFIFNGDNSSVQVWDNVNDYWINNENLNINVSQAVILQNYTLAVGHISYMSLTGAQGGAYVSDPELSSLPYELKGDSNDYYTALYLNQSMNVVGGQFNTSNKIQNLIFINNTNETFGLNGIKWGYNTKVIDLLAKDSNLFIGLENGVTIEDKDINGVIIYDLVNKSFPVQPASLFNNQNNNQGTVKVNSMVASESSLYVGGDFTNAGSLSCVSFCSYLLDESRWSNPLDSDDAISGEIFQMSFYSSTELLISGDLSIGNDKAKFAIYDTKENSLKTADTALNNGLNTIIKKFILVDQDSITKRIIAMGDHYLGYHNGANWIALTDDIVISETNFTSIQLVDLKNSNSRNNETIFDNDQILMISGMISHKQYGNFSTGFFNGTAWIPYLFTESDSMTNVILQSKTTGSTSSNYSLKSKVMKVRNVVGVGFACALCSLLIIVLSYCVYYFLVGKKNIYKRPLEARVAEKDMLETVPPNQLMISLDHAKYMAE